MESLFGRKEEDRNEDINCSDNSGTILYLRALQGHSGNNLIDPTLQDNVVIGSGIFPTFTTLDVRLIFILLSTMDWYLEVKI